ncbi:MAG TPA: SH3 domain-containing protein [Vicinamibacterales bacterium]
MDKVVNAVIVREAASINSEVVGRLHKGEQATLILAVPRWYRVRLSDGTEGFVSKAWTTRVAQSAPATPAATLGDPAFTVHFLDVGTGDQQRIDCAEAADR